jgi:hypothetical protein
MVPGKEGFPQLHGSQSAANHGGADDGDVGHVLEDGSGAAGGMAGLIR